MTEAERNAWDAMREVLRRRMAECPRCPGTGLVWSHTKDVEVACAACADIRLTITLADQATAEAR
jgi:uncharacterized protein (DUF983 family)